VAASATTAQKIPEKFIGDRLNDTASQSAVKDEEQVTSFRMTQEERGIVAAKNERDGD
jgi:hypothetical protein